MYSALGFENRYPQWFFSVFLDRYDIGPRLTPKFPHFAYFIPQTKISSVLLCTHLSRPPSHLGTHKKRKKKDKMSCLNLIDLHNNELSLSTTKPTKWVVKDPRLLHADSEDSVRTGQMPRLTCVCTLRTDHFVGFFVLWLIFMSQCQHRDWRQIHNDLSKKLMASFKERLGDIQSFFTLFSKFAF